MIDQYRLLFLLTPVVFFPALTYEVFILTGDCRGGGTDADVKLTLFGEYGTSVERQLLKSMNHSRKFRRGQVNIL